MDLVTFEYIKGENGKPDTTYHVVHNPPTDRLVGVINTMHQFSANREKISREIAMHKDVIDAKSGLNIKVSTMRHRDFPHSWIIYKQVSNKDTIIVIPVGYFLGYATEVCYENAPPMPVYMIKHAYFSTEIAEHTFRLSKEIITRYTGIECVITANTGCGGNTDFAKTTTYINPTLAATGIPPLEPLRDPEAIAKAITTCHLKQRELALQPGKDTYVFGLSPMQDLVEVIKALLLQDSVRILGRKDDAGYTQLVIISVDSEVARVIYAQGLPVRSLERLLKAYAKFMVMDSNAFYPDSEFIEARFRLYSENYYTVVGRTQMTPAKAILVPYL